MASPSSIPVPPAPAPQVPSQGGFPTPDEAFKLVRFRTEVEVARYGYPWHPEKLVPIRGGFALLMSWAEDSCHACKPTLGVAYFHRRDGRWKPYGLWDNLYQDGWNGSFGDMEVIDIGQPNPTVAVHGGWFGEGCDVDGMGLVELAPDRPIMRVVRAPLGAGNGGQTSDPKYRMGYEATVSPLRGRPGLKIRYRGELERERQIDVTVIYTGPGRRWTAHPHIFKADCANYWMDGG
jgi:hypothetical protein